MAAGLGLEPRYHPPEGCVLPLDDPALLRQGYEVQGKPTPRLPQKRCFFN